MSIRARKGLRLSNNNISRLITISQVWTCQFYICPASILVEQYRACCVFQVIMVLLRCSRQKTVCHYYIWNGSMLFIACGYHFDNIFCRCAKSQQLHVYWTFRSSVSSIHCLNFALPGGKQLEVYRVTGQSFVPPSCWVCLPVRLSVFVSVICESNPSPAESKSVVFSIITEPKAVESAGDWLLPISVAVSSYSA